MISHIQRIKEVKHNLKEVVSSESKTKLTRRQRLISNRIQLKLPHATSSLHHIRSSMFRILSEAFHLAHLDSFNKEQAPPVNRPVKTLLESIRETLEKLNRRSSQNETKSTKREIMGSTSRHSQPFLPGSNARLKLINLTTKGHY